MRSKPSALLVFGILLAIAGFGVIAWWLATRGILSPLHSHLLFRK